MKKRNKGLTLIELLVTIAIIAILVLLATPRLLGHTNKAKMSEITTNTRSIQDAAKRYYFDHGEMEWPRLTDKPYTETEVKSFAEKIYDVTGEEVNLDPNGNYYDIDFDKLKPYIDVPGEKANYILQNPVGKVFHMEGLSEEGQDRLIPEELKAPQYFSFTGAVQTFEVPINGVYLLEVWGGQGKNYTIQFNNITEGGKGGYAKGEVSLKKGEIVYIYNGGGSGSRFNGGGYARYEGGYGGGATHMAKSKGLLKDLSDKKSDVLIVAGGGGGASGTSKGGVGGGLNGGGSRVGTQTRGGKAIGNYNGMNTDGTFGQGGGNKPTNANDGHARAGGGGGGWYGGGSGGSGYRSGGGGSSYIDSLHNGQTISGNQSMPNPNGGTMTGNSGSGSSKITYLGK